MFTPANWLVNIIIIGSLFSFAATSAGLVSTAQARSLTKQVGPRIFMEVCIAQHYNLLLQKKAEHK